MPHSTVRTREFLIETPSDKYAINEIDVKHRPNRPH